MALAPVNTNYQPLPRSELASFLKNQRQIDSFERLQQDNDAVVEAVNQLVSVTSDIVGSPILTFAAASVFSNERVLAAGYGIDVTIGVSTASVSQTPTGVSPGPYGGPATIPTFTVDDCGRVLSAGGEELNSDNVTEGEENLFYTDARSRASLSGGAGIAYDDETGEVSAASAGTYGAPTGALSRATFATYTAPTISNPPTQAEVQAMADHLQVISQTLAALITDMRTNGNLE